MLDRINYGPIGITDCNPCRGEVHLESRESRINEQIRVSQVRLIDENGEQLGIVSTYDARRQAQEKGLDLVEIAPQAQPPVCKIMNYGKFRYSKEKQEKKNRKAQIKVKELKLRPGIADNDIMIKVSHAKEFLSEGNKVKVTCMFRGREMAHTEIGEAAMQRFVDELKDFAMVEIPPKMTGRSLCLVLAPAKQTKGDDRAKNEN